METTMWSGVDQVQSITGKMDSSTINWPLLLLRSIAILIVYCTFRVYMAGRWYTAPVSAKDRVAIVTGANSGIGYETALELAARGAHVILACRNMNAAEQAAERIRHSTQNPNVTCRHLDLGEQKSVRQFAAEFMQKTADGRSPPRLDILVNNGGIMAVPWQLTADGYEQHMGTNHFGHFALTLLLLPVLRRTPNARIVNVTSMCQRWVKMPNDLKNVGQHDGYNRFVAYAHSKLANAIFTRELARRLGRMDVTVNCVHPGVIHTDIQKNLESLNFILHRNICNFVTKLMLPTAQSGAQCSLFACLDVNLQYVTGEYFENLWFSKYNEQALDEKLCKTFWQHSEQVTGVKFDDHNYIMQ